MIPDLELHNDPAIEPDVFQELWQALSVDQCITVQLDPSRLSEDPEPVRVYVCVCVCVYYVYTCVCLHLCVCLCVCVLMCGPLSLSLVHLMHTYIFNTHIISAHIFIEEGHAHITHTHTHYTQPSHTHTTHTHAHTDRRRTRLTRCAYISVWRRRQHYAYLPVCTTTTFTTKRPILSRRNSDRSQNRCSDKHSKVTDRAYCHSAVCFAVPFVLGGACIAVVIVNIHQHRKHPFIRSSFIIVTWLLCTCVSCVCACNCDRKVSSYVCQCVLLFLT